MNSNIWYGGEKENRTTGPKINHSGSCRHHALLRIFWAWFQFFFWISFCDFTQRFYRLFQLSFPPLSDVRVLVVHTAQANPIAPRILRHVGNMFWNCLCIQPTSQQAVRKGPPETRKSCPKLGEPRPEQRPQAERHLGQPSAPFQFTQFSSTGGCAAHLGKDKAPEGGTKGQAPKERPRAPNERPKSAERAAKEAQLRSSKKS